MSGRHLPPISRPSPKVTLPEEPLKAPSNTYERISYFGRNVYKQLTATRLRMFVVGAFPFVAYISTSFVDYQRQRYEFRLQQSTFFKNSIAAIANSPEIRQNYGKNIKLKRASFWTVSSGFVPWIKERHVWLGFSGNLQEGWIRMGLRRTEFVLNKDVFKALGKQIDNELAEVLKNSIREKSGEVQATSETDVTSSSGTVSEEKTQLSDDKPDDTAMETSSGCEGSLDNVDEGADKITADQEMSAEERIHKSAHKVDHLVDENSGSANDDDKLEELTAREIMDRKLLAKEVRDKVQFDASKEYLKKVRALYPQLSENFSQNDLEQAIALRKDRLLMGQAFDKTWDLLSLSIHPDSKAKDIPVYVLYDPENSYVDQGDYVIDTNFLSIKRKEAMQTEIVKREMPSQAH